MKMTKQHKYQGGRLLAVGLGLMTAIAAYGTASADSYPDKPITFIVPYSPGGGS
ncbi:MAG: tripartite-type tricarboxylate transporter receptor subunit TctC, partial [Alphaproteobacteria bacterium]